MSVNYKKQNIKVNDKVCQDFAQVMVENDIVVSEGKPDILKIIQIDTRAFVTKTELSAGKAVISGMVSLNILYICDREGESLKALAETVPFEHTVENPKIKEGMMAHVSVEVTRIDFELLNSRKIRLKISMTQDTTVNTDREFGLIYDVDDDENNLQIRRQSVRVYTLSSNQNKTFDVQEELILPDSKPSIRDILKVNAHITEKELKIASGKAVVQGTLNVCTLYTNDSNGGVEFCQHDVNFTEVFDISKVPEGADCEIDIAVDDIKWMPKFDSDGNIRKIAVTISLSSVANVSENIDVNLITDCYAPNCCCNVKRESYEFDEFLGESKAQSVVKELVEIKEGMPAISRIYNVITKPYITSNGIENGRVHLEGCIDTYILYICDDDISPIFSFKKEIPFTHTMDISGIRDNAQINVKCEVANVSYNIVSDRQVEIRAVLDIGVCLTNVTRCNAVQDIEIKPEERPHRCSVLVYYVKSGDTLWKIGKKYGVSMEDIKKANDMEDDGALKEGMFLIIPHVRKYQTVSE